MGRHNVTGIRVVEASESKTKCLKLLDEVVKNREEIVITKNGSPVSRLVPYHEKPKSLFGIDKGRFEIQGDVVAPVDVEWEAQSGRTWDANQ